MKRTLYMAAVALVMVMGSSFINSASAQYDQSYDDQYDDQNPLNPNNNNENGGCSLGSGLNPTSGILSIAFAFLTLTLLRSRKVN